MQQFSSVPWLFAAYIFKLLYIYIYSYKRGDEILPKGIFTSQYKDSVMTLMCVFLLV